MLVVGWADRERAALVGLSRLLETCGEVVEPWSAVGHAEGPQAMTFIVVVQLQE